MAIGCIEVERVVDVFKIAQWEVLRRQVLVPEHPSIKITARAMSKIASDHILLK